MAVHSLKDVETSLPSKIVLACYLKRDSKEDALIVRSSLRATTKSLNQLESENGIIGTSSVRRKAFLARNFPFLKTVDIRGNIDTRIEKMETRDISALILSAAGLERMGWSHLIAEKLDVPHAVSQGVIAVACLESKTKIAGLLETVDDEETRLSCIAERALLSGLKGGCKVPVGVTTSFSRAGMQFNLKLRAAVCSLDGKEFCEESEQIKFENNGEKEVEAAKLGIRVAESLDKKGAQRILRGCRDLVAA
ncbi:porphobilinogen deaminase, variant 2, partial [Bonamia ostreae]